jgi:DNA polymerase
MATSVLIDFETASRCDLKKCGAYVYARHPSTEILCVGYSIDGGPPEVLTAGDLAFHATLLFALAKDEAVNFVCHNAMFERNIWQAIMVERFGWPEIPIRRWHDTMAVSLMKGLSGKLDVLAHMLSLQTKKDLEGSRLTVSLSRPNKKTGTYDRSPETLARVGAYCKTDVGVEIDILKRVGDFQSGEREVWELDQRINDRGIAIDADYVRAGIDICNRVIPEISAKFEALVGCRPTQRDKFLAWMRGQGCEIADLRKETVATLLGEAEDDFELSEPDCDTGDISKLPEPCKKALELRAQINHASIKKLHSMLAVRGSDGRARGLLQYHGAGPGRWAGRLLQPQNFPRGTGEFGVDEVVSAIMSKDPEYIRATVGDPISTVSNGLRHALIAKPGTRFLMGDYTQVEARLVLALAGAKRGLDAFIRGNPYVEMAERIFHRPINKKENLHEYTIGKNTILGAGFGMGAKTFHKRYCTNEDIAFAESAIDAYRKDFAPEVPKLWRGLEKAAITAVWEKRPCEAYGVEYRLEGEWLTARLPSGRKLWYFAPKPCRRAVPWDKNDLRPAWTSLAYRAGQLVNRDMYGGLLTENVIQALARDLLVYAMFRCEAAGLPIVLTVHDEIVLETDRDSVVLENIMLERSRWAEDMGMPVGVEISEGERYKK